ncbi:MAG: FG-GAP-like repeat-containing protein [candidate division KSB1 bacterium]|nr:FG-GAP-like repeat-containing protein [candidate division KSB1 bacterium]
MDRRALAWRGLVLAACIWTVGAAAQQIRFTDITEAKNVKGYLVNGVSVYGHGVAMADVTGDGLPEIYVSQANEGTSSYPEVFYVSVRNAAYTEEASRRGLRDSYGIGSHGVVFFDLDNDDDWDVYNGNTTARNRLYRNRGNGFFDDITVSAGLRDWPYSTRGVVAFDANKDGYMDLYCVGAGLPDNQAEPNEFYINQKNGTFQLVDWGLRNVTQDGFGQQGVTAADVDNDGDIDIYICRRDNTHDGKWGSPCNLLFINNGDNTFSEQAGERGVRGAFWNDGATFVDYDNDGDLDLFVIGQSKYLGKVYVYRNRGDGYFEDVTNTLNLAGRGYTVLPIDADNDGDIDLYIPQHFGSTDSPNRAIFYRNDGGRFVALSSTGAEIYSYDPRGGAVADVDDDGDLDIYFADANKAADARYWNRLLRNDTQTSNKWLKVYGRGPEGDKGGIGTKVWVFDKGYCDSLNHLVGYRQMMSAYGYLCQDDYVLHFGLGQRDSVDVKVVLLDGTTLRARSVPANTKLYFSKPAQLAMVDGNGQQGPGNVALPAPLRVKVTDQYGKNVVGAQVTFTVVTGNGRFLEQQPVSTDRLGVASTHFVMGSVGLTQSVRATCADVPGATVDFTASISPHRVAGKVRYPNGTIPPVATFTAFKTSYPDEVMTQSSPGCGYSSGSYWIQCENFPHTWTPGETLRVEVRDGGVGRGSASVVFSSAAVDSLNLVISVFTRQITVATNPPGLQLRVDGQLYLAPQTFTWIEGSSHTVEAPSPLAGGPGTRYVFGTWSDGGGQSHSIIVPAHDYSITAQYETQYELTVVSAYGAPYGGGWYPAGSSVTFGVTSPDTTTPGTRRLFQGWEGSGQGSYSGPNAVATVVMSNPISEQADWQTQYRLWVFSAYGSPTGQGWYNAGATARFGVTSPEVHGATRYVFSGWKGDFSGSGPVDSLRMDGPKSITASWVTEHLLTVLTPYGTAFGQGWYRQGSTATFGVAPSVVGLNGGTRLVFARWTGEGQGAYTGADTTASVVMSNPVTERAQWTRQYRLTTAVSPPEGGTMIPQPPGLWCDSLAVVALSAVPNSTGGYTFAGWSGALSGTANPASLTMNGPKSVTANFTPPGHVRVTTEPSGLSVVVDGVTYNAPCDFDWPIGSTHSIGVISPQPGAQGVRYVFSSWSDGGQQNHTVVVTGGALYAARFGTEYFLSLSTTPQEGGTLVPAPPGGWYAQGATVVLTATPAPGFVWGGWAGDLVGMPNPATVVMSRPLSATATFLTVRQIVVASVPEGRQIVVDGIPYEAPQTFSWPTGSRHTLAAPSPQSIGAGRRYRFYSWSDGGEQTHEVVVDNTTSYTAVFGVECFLATQANPPQGGDVVPAPPGEWYPEGSQVEVRASADGTRGYSFWGWSGDLRGTQNPALVGVDAPKQVRANFGLGSYAPPILLYSYPRPGSVGAPRNATVFLGIQARSGGIDPSTLQVEVEGSTVLSGGVDQTGGRASMLLVGDTYTVAFHPATPYRSNGHVTVRVECEDLGYHLGRLDTSFAFATCRDTAFVMLRQTVDQMGGTLSLEHTGIQVLIPEGALTAPTPLEIGFIWDPPALPSNVKAVDLFHYLGPDGLTFADSVTVGIEYSWDTLGWAGVTRPVDIPCYRYSSREGAWTRVPVYDANDHELFVRLKEFCYLTLATEKTEVAQTLDAAVPQCLALLPNYPNPFNPVTVLEYHVPTSGLVQLGVYNVRGQLVATLCDRPHQPGVYRVAWDGRDASGQPVASGVYVAVLRHEGEVRRIKLLLAK